MAEQRYCVVHDLQAEKSQELQGTTSLTASQQMTHSKDPIVPFTTITTASTLDKSIF
jgi:hypothetical protein